jgi:methyl-accepting chemotaxis protein
MKLKMREIKYFLPGLIGVGFFVMIILNGFSTYLDGQNELDTIREQLVENLKNDLDIFVNVETKNLEVAAELLLNDKEVLQLFAWQDRRMLADHLLPIYEGKLKTDFGIKQFQFHLPPATSFLRLHKVEKYGDDLSSFRKTVVQSNNEKSIVSGLEVGVGGLGVRLVHPVNNDGMHIGTMEFGTAFKEILNSIANKNNVTYAIGIHDHVFESAGRKENTSNDYIKDNTVYYDFSNELTKENLKEIKTKLEVESVSVNDRDFAVVSIPIRDYSNKEIGFATFFHDETEIIANIYSNILWGIRSIKGLYNFS